MIPQEKNAGVIRALREAFRVTEFEDICRMTKGLSSDLVFRIVVRGLPYVLRIMTRMDERMDPHRIFTCMNAASSACITPRVRYANAEDGISITDFVEAAPFPATKALVQLPDMLRRLHALSPFPKTFNFVTAHEGFIWRFRKTGILPKDEIEQAFSKYEQLCAVYPQLDSDMVSCHMDLKPENILFDGERVWLIDWQAAFVNDRYFDLAIAANFVVNNDSDEIIYLERYFGHRPDKYQLAKFFLMRQMLHMFYATVFLLLASAKQEINLNEKLPTFKDFHNRMRVGEVDLANNNMKIIYGRLHWEQLLRNVQQVRFKEALTIVSERHAGRGDMQRLFPLQQ